jgi:hypothetical protein
MQQLNSQKELSWFEEQEMSSIICTLPDGEKEKEVEIMSKKDARHYFDMQARGYSFRKREVKPRVHISDSTCTSCEG